MFSRNRLIIFFLLLATAFSVYFYSFQSHRDIQNEVSLYSLQSEELIREFDQNSAIALSKYSNQVITFTGTLTQQLETSLVIQNRIHCSLIDSLSPLKLKSTLVIKGRCVGYDDLLNEIKLDQCAILN